MKEPELKELELYLHIPFCAQKCKYCDFLSAPADQQVQNAYMDALEREIEEKAANQSGAEEIPAYCVTSIFIGGGTPSILPAERIVNLVQCVRTNYRVAPDAEISIEVNPGTVTYHTLCRYREAGINRLSIGCQSTDDAELARIGRIHNFARFLETYQWAREAGFENVNVDLMIALPGQNIQAVEKNLGRILALAPQPEHISVYSLILEEGTELYAMWERGELWQTESAQGVCKVERARGACTPELRLPDEDEEREMYWRTADILREAGYEHYEISNFAREGYRCRHNCGYWERREYLGFGIGAASLYQNVRFSNERDLKAYIERWSMGNGGLRQKTVEGQAAEAEVVWTTRDWTAQDWDTQEVTCLTREDCMAETMFLGLRMADGVDVEEFGQLYGRYPEEVYGDEIAESVEQGLLREQDGRLVLTRRGLDISNYVMAKFLPD